MKFRIELLVVLVAGLVVACGGEPEDPFDSSQQRAADLLIINDYIAERGYAFDPGDTTASGVRYVILDEGTGDYINSGDIVDLYYAGRLTTRELFDTNIDTMAINDGTFDSSATYTPQRLTFTETGWAIRDRFVRGYSDGVTAVLDTIRIGGRAEIIIPSDLAYGNAIGHPLRNTVLVFELYPAYKR